MAASKSKSAELKSNEAKRSTAREWKSRAVGQDLRLPSGVVVLVKRLGPQAFLSEGFVPDSLAPIIQEAIREGKGLPPEKQKELGSDPRQIADMMSMMDRVLVKSVVEPAVHFLPPCVSQKTGQVCGEDPLASIHQDAKASGWHVYVEGDKDDDLVYVDEVDFEDKSFIFQYVMGGTSDLERFRKEQASDVESVSNS